MKRGLDPKKQKAKIDAAVKENHFISKKTDCEEEGKCCSKENFVSKPTGEKLVHSVADYREIGVNKANVKTTFTLCSDYEVHFPFNSPYECQFDIMAKVIKSKHST